MIHKLIENEDEAPRMLHLGNSMKTVDMEDKPKPIRIKLGGPPVDDDVEDFLEEFDSMTTHHPFARDMRYFTFEGYPVMVELKRTASDPKKCVYIGAIIVPPALRAKKYASKVLKIVCDLADKHGVKLDLIAARIKTDVQGLPGRQLKAWYQRYGFVFKGDHGVREPQPSTT